MQQEVQVKTHLAVPVPVRFWTAAGVAPGRTPFPVCQARFHGLVLWNQVRVPRQEERVAVVLQNQRLLLFRAVRVFDARERISAFPGGTVPTEEARTRWKRPELTWGGASLAGVLGGVRAAGRGEESADASSSAPPHAEDFRRTLEARRISTGISHDSGSEPRSKTRKI